MMFATILRLLATSALGLASMAQAAPEVEILVVEAGQRDLDGTVLVELRLLNGDTKPRTVAMEDRIEARVDVGGQSQVVWLERDGNTPADLAVPSAGFARARYRLRPPSDLAGDHAILLVPAWGRETLLTSRPAPADARLAQATPMAEPAEPRPEQRAPPPPTDRAPGNAFLANLSAYQPVYAVYGPGTNSDARIQLSFKYQLFGSRRGEGASRSWLDGLHFAYTQRMFWDLGAHSSPFRNIDYQPELIYITPSATLANGMSVSGQAGIRHESNGRDGLASRSINSVYIAPTAAMSLGGGYQLAVAPRLSLFVGDKSDNPDIRRYRGNTDLFLEIGKDDGLRLTTSTRFNFSSGKGAVDANLSYPLARILGGGPDLYLFGQGFAGYGENLLDYNRHITRLRLGVALVR